MKWPWSKFPEREDSPGRTVTVGWHLDIKAAGLIWGDPRPYRRKQPKPASAKSLQLCPAANDFDARHWVIECPVDLNLSINIDAPKGPAITNLDGAGATIRNNALNKMLYIVPRNEWRAPDRPIVQIGTPYIFLADEPVWINQLPPFLDYADPPWPGTLVAGRFPVHVWPRGLVWAFEWCDVRKPLVIRRGQPWFYVRFDTERADGATRLVACDIPPDVRDYLDSVAGVTNYVNRTYSLFDRARSRRPRRLVYPKAP